MKPLKAPPAPSRLAHDVIRQCSASRPTYLRHRSWPPDRFRAKSRVYIEVGTIFHAPESPPEKPSRAHAPSGTELTTKQRGSPPQEKPYLEAGRPVGLRHSTIDASSLTRNPPRCIGARWWQLSAIFEVPRSPANLRGEVNALEYSMRFRSIGCAAIICISFLTSGCALRRYVSMSDLWRAQEVRQQRLAREAGRIGHIGNAGPALGTSLPSGSN